MANSLFELLFDFKVDRGGLNVQLNKMRDDIKGFNERIKDETAIQFSLKAWDLKTQLDLLRRQLAAAKQSGDFDLQVKINADLARTSNELTQAQRELRNYARTGSADISVLGKNFESVNNSIDRQGSLISKALGSLRGSFWGLGSLVGGVFAVGSATAFVKTMFDLTSQVQQAQIAFTKLSGSQEIAKKLFKDIQIFAAQTPFDQLGLVDGAKRLLAYGFQAKQVIPIMNSLGNAVAATGWWQDSLNGVIVALWQMQTKGKLVQQELNQIAERGIPVFDILKTKLGLTQEQMGKVWEQGISAAQAIPAILEGINERFGGVMAEQSKTLQGQLSNLIDIFKINMANLWAELAPIMAWVLGLLRTIIEPAFNILILWVRGFKFVFETVFSGLSAIYRVFADNFVAITKFVLATFTSALIIMQRQTIISFVEGTVKRIIAGMQLVGASMISGGKAVISFVGNLGTLIRTTALSTVARVKDTAAKIYNTVATRSQIIRNNLASLSFRALWWSILSTVKNLLFLATRFFLIGAIVATVVGLIYANRDKLKQKLKPVFEFIAKIGAAAPWVIAKSRNGLVDFISTIVRGILNSAANVASVIEKITGVSIGADAIKGASDAFGNFASGLKITEQDVSAAFNSIKDGAIGAFESIKGWVTGGLGDINNIAGAFWWAGNAAEDAGKKAKKWGKELTEAQKDAQKGIEDTTNATKDYEKALERLDKATQDLKDANQEYKDAVIKNNNDIINKLRDAQKEYDKTIKKIIETRDEELKSIEAKRVDDKNKNVLDFAKDQAEEYAKSLQEVVKLRQKLAQEDDSTRQAEIQADISKELLAQEQIQRNLEELKKSGVEGDAKRIEDIVKEAQYRASLTEQERAIYDFKQKQLDTDIKAKEEAQKATQKAVDDQVKALQDLENTRASIETQKKIIAELDKVKFITKDQVNSFLDSDKFRKFDEDSQKLFEELLKIKLKISEAGTTKNTAATDAKNKEIELENKLADLQKKNLKDVKDKYDEIISKVWELQDKSTWVFAASAEVQGATGGKTTAKKTDKTLNSIEAVTPSTAIADEQAIADGKLGILQNVRATEAKLSEEKKIEDADKYLNEQTLHAQTVAAIQAVTQSGVANMQGIRQGYYANVVNMTRGAVSSMVSEYSRLASSLREVIALQARANSGRGFATGWYTGSGGKYEVAGVVHKWEYVVPQRMVNKYGGAVKELESIRTRWFAEGWFTSSSTTNRNVNVGNVTVSGDFDFDRAMEKWRRKI